MAEKVKTAQQVEAADVWASLTNAERVKWLKNAGCAANLDTTTFEDLAPEVQEALELKKPS